MTKLVPWQADTRPVQGSNMRKDTLLCAHKLLNKEPS